MDRFNRCLLGRSYFRPTIREIIGWILIGIACFALAHGAGNDHVLLVIMTFWGVLSAYMGAATLQRRLCYRQYLVQRRAALCQIGRLATDDIIYDGMIIFLIESNEGSAIGRITASDIEYLDPGTPLQLPVAAFGFSNRLFDVIRRTMVVQAQWDGDDVSFNGEEHFNLDTDEIADFADLASASITDLAAIAEALHSGEIYIH